MSKPDYCVDCVVFHNRRVLLIQRGRDPFKYAWALPGGRVNWEEQSYHAARRELYEETGVQADECRLSQRLIGVYDKPGIDPRGWGVTVAYAFEVPPVLAQPVLCGGDDAMEAQWFKIENVLSNVKLAFNHKRILLDAYEARIWNR